MSDNEHEEPAEAVSAKDIRSALADTSDHEEDEEGGGEEAVCILCWHLDLHYSTTKTSTDRNYPVGHIRRCK